MQLVSVIMVEDDPSEWNDVIFEIYANSVIANSRLEELNHQVKIINENIKKCHECDIDLDKDEMKLQPCYKETSRFDDCCLNYSGYSEDGDKRYYIKQYELKGIR